jgi:hypothetical protein
MSKDGIRTWLIGLIAGRDLAEIRPKKKWLVRYWWMLSLWRRRGRQNGVALEYVLSTEKPPSYGSCSGDDVGLERPEDHVDS